MIRLDTYSHFGANVLCRLRSSQFLYQHGPQVLKKRVSQCNKAPRPIQSVMSMPRSREMHRSPHATLPPSANMAIKTSSSVLLRTSGQLIKDGGMPTNSLWAESCMDRLAVSPAHFSFFGPNLKAIITHAASASCVPRK